LTKEAKSNTEEIREIKEKVELLNAKVDRLSNDVAIIKE